MQCKITIQGDRQGLFFFYSRAGLAAKDLIYRKANINLIRKEIILVNLL